MSAPRHVTSTGTALTVEDAGHVLSRYLQSFGVNPSTCRHSVAYSTVPPSDTPVAPGGSQFAATIQLPVIAGSGTYASGPWPSKLMAKRVACWDACKSLLDRGELNEDLMPTPNGGPPVEKKRRHREGRDAASLSRWVEEGDAVLGDGDEDLQRGLSLSARWEVFKGMIKGSLPERSPAIGAGPAGVGVYEALVPEGLDQVVPRRAWMTSLQLFGERTLGLLTAKRLAEGVEELELKPGAVMRMTDLGQMKKISEDQWVLIARYTEQAIRSQLNKDLHLPSTGPTWLIVPLLRSFASDPSSTAKRTDIDWEEIQHTISLAPTSSPFTITDPAAIDRELVDAIATSPSEFGRRFYIDSLTDLTPSSPHPTEPSKTILEYSFANPKYGPPVVEHPDQRVFAARVATSGRSGGILAPPPPDKLFYFAPELNQRYCFPASTYRSLSTIPTFFCVLTDYLAAKQFNTRIFDGTLQPLLSLQALTPPMCAPNRPNRNYERLEILGDTLIKLLTTLDTCLGGPLSDSSRVDRHILLSNRSLRANGVDAGIAPYIRAKEGLARTWIPEGWTLQGEIKADDAEKPVAKRTVQIGDKVVADVVEALVGASYLSCGRNLDAAISSMKRLNIPIDHLHSWAEIGKVFARHSALDLEIEAQAQALISKRAAKKAERAAERAAEKGEKVEKMQKVEKAETVESAGWMAAFTKPVAFAVLDYTFKDSKKGELVFNATSKTRGRQDFQMYKLFGDSLMDYFVVEKLYDIGGDYTPAVITHMKHSRNADQSLAAMSVCLGLVDRVTDMDKPIEVEVKRHQQQITARWKEAENILKRRAKQAKQGEEEIDDADGSKVIEFWGGSCHAPVRLLYRRRTALGCLDVAHLQIVGALPEVLLGAIVADQGGDLKAAHKMFADHFWPFMEKYGVGPISHSLHPKSVLSEKLGKYGCTTWKMVRLDEPVKGILCSVQIHGNEIARAIGESQVLATRKACENALEVLKPDLVKQYCTCGPVYATEEVTKAEEQP